MSGFEFFEGAATPDTTPRITVRRTGQLILTQGAAAMLGQDVTHVQLGYDPTTRAVGLRSVPQDTKGRYRLRTQPNGVSSLVDGKRFLAHHGLTLPKARSFEAEHFGDGVVGFRFEEGGEPVAAAAKVERKARQKAAPRD